MKLDRRVVARKRQLLVPIPPEVRDHLGLIGGARVWWHVSRKGQVVVTTSGHSRGGRPTADADCPSCAKYRGELDRYRRELREGESATPAQLFRQGYLQAVRHYGGLSDRLDVALAFLKELLGRERHRPRPRPGARSASARAVETAPGPDHYPEPSPSPDVAGVEEGADTSGAQLPGVPLEH